MPVSFDLNVMIDKELITKYLGGSLNPEESRKLLEWLKEDPQNEDWLFSLKSSHNMLDYDKNARMACTDEEWVRLKPFLKNRNKRRFPGLWMPAAAVVILIFFLGPIKVAGLTRWELSELIKNKLLNDGLLTDAVVTVEFMNFKVSVIGEVNAPGTYSLQNDKVTILQAISLARDLTIFGQRENVCVIREREGERVIYEINLCDVSMFNSPAYYLQQNDVVYVQPSEVKARQSTTDDKALRMTSIFVSGGSLLVSIAALIVNLIR